VPTTAPQRCPPRPPYPQTATLAVPQTSHLDARQPFSTPYLVSYPYSATNPAPERPKTPKKAPILRPIQHRGWRIASSASCKNRPPAPFCPLSGILPLHRHQPRPRTPENRQNRPNFFPLQAPRTETRPPKPNPLPSVPKNQNKRPQRRANSPAGILPLPSH
jgi:hypothetical protein